MKTIAVTTTHLAETLREAADLVVDSLEEIDVAGIAALFIRTASSVLRESLTELARARNGECEGAA